MGSVTCTAIPAPPSAAQYEQRKNNKLLRKPAAQEIRRTGKWSGRFSLPPVAAALQRHCADGHSADDHRRHPVTAPYVDNERYERTRKQRDREQVNQQVGPVSVNA